MRLVVDTNVVIDFLVSRMPFYYEAEKLMYLGYAHEVELWISAAQINDLFYTLTDGGKHSYAKDAQQRLKKLRPFINFFSVSKNEIEATLDSNWLDLEDACLYQVALSLKADFIISRNQKDFGLSSIQTLDASEFFDYLKKEKRLVYELIENF